MHSVSKIFKILIIITLIQCRKKSCIKEKEPGVQFVLKKNRIFSKRKRVKSGQKFKRLCNC